MYCYSLSVQSIEFFFRSLYDGFHWDWDDHGVTVRSKSTHFSTVNYEVTWFG